MGVAHVMLTEHDHIEHHFCIFHIRNNVKKVLKSNGETSKTDLVMKYVNSAAYARNEEVFESSMSQLQTSCPVAHSYLADIDSIHWSKHAFKLPCSERMASQASESINALLLNLRGLYPLSFFRRAISRWLKLVGERRERMTKSLKEGKTY
jgi:hypothetical protein